ncbi:Nn.00g080400.m01.CDS01 [Neocucurbitaria sp. VM-36]
MPPTSEQVQKIFSRQVTETLSVTLDESPTWSQPGDVFSVLLILGGDIVHRALAQLVGTRITPVTFSFGWVSYAVSALYTSVSNASLMPPGSECPILVFTAKNGYVRANNSWVLSRLLRDFESWMDIAVRNKLDEIMRARHNYMKSHARKGTTIPMPKKSGLCISIYEPSGTRKAGDPTLDYVYWSGPFVVSIQLAVAAVPIIVSRDWSTMVITAIGSVLAFLTGALPHWRKEKWFGRRNAMNSYILTRGNGAQHALMIIGNKHGLNLEDLAVGAENLDTASAGWTTRASMFTLSCLWIALLIGAAGLSQPSWYLLCVGGIGMLQNLLVAGWRRQPGALGIHLKFRGVIGHMSTMDALLELETQYPNAGRSLLRTFFPGTLFPDEEAKWAALRARSSVTSAAAVDQQQQIEQPVRQPDALESWAQQARSFEK